MAKTFKLKNDSKRSFQIGVLKDLKVFKPGEVGIFNEENAEKLLKHKGVIDLDNISITYDETAVVDFADNKPQTKEAKKSAEKTDSDEDKKLASALKNR